MMIKKQKQDIINILPCYATKNAHYTYTQSKQTVLEKQGGILFTKRLIFK